MFWIAGRGWVMVLEEKFSGKVAVGHILEGANGRTTIQEVEMVDSRDGADLNGLVGLLIGDAARSLFAAGQQVKFYKQR